MKRGSIAIVGTGRLGTALTQRLVEAGYRVSKIFRRNSPKRMFAADVIWFCVPDDVIPSVARTFSRTSWTGKIAFHSSGVLSSDALDLLRRAGASIASVHPLMTFVTGSMPELAGVPFAIEGDPDAIRVARAIVRSLGGKPVTIRREHKVAYHAFATMICPLLVSLLRASESVAELAKISEGDARRRMMPIIRQTLRNYERLGPAGAFSGPIVRGDMETVRAHLSMMKRIPVSRSAYTALAAAALELLPTRNRTAMANLLCK